MIVFAGDRQEQEFEDRSTHERVNYERTGPLSTTVLGIKIVTYALVFFIRNLRKHYIDSLLAQMRIPPKADQLICMDNRRLSFRTTNSVDATLY